MPERSQIATQVHLVMWPASDKHPFQLFSSLTQPQHVDQILLCNPLQPPHFYSIEEIKHVDELCVLSVAASETATAAHSLSHMANT